MRLNESEFLIAFVLEYLREESNVVVFSKEGLNPIDYGGSPLHYNVLKAILLIEVSVHILFHSLSWLSECLALLVELYLRTIDVVNNVF